jgi:hypothetical protein
MNDHQAPQDDAAQKPQKTPRERFLTVAEKRTLRVLKDLRLLGNCGNRRAYEYSEEDVEKVFGAIERELARTRAKFEGDKDIDFTLK